MSLNSKGLHEISIKKSPLISIMLPIPCDQSSSGLRDQFSPSSSDHRLWVPVTIFMSLRPTFSTSLQLLPLKKSWIFLHKTLAISLTNLKNKQTFKSKPKYHFYTSIHYKYVSSLLLLVEVF